MGAAFLAGMAVHALWTRAHSPVVQEALATSEKKPEVVARKSPMTARTWEVSNFHPKTPIVFELHRPNLYDPFDLFFSDLFWELDFQLFDSFFDLGFEPSQWERLFQEMMPPMRYQLIEHVDPRHVTKKSQPAPLTP